MRNQQETINIITKPFPLNPRYLVTSDGHILSMTNGEPLKPTDLRGYKRCHLRIDGKGKSMLVHRVVAITFLDNPENFKEVNHKNGIKHDNRVENLEWVTRERNMSHAFQNGLNTNTGVNNGRCVLTEQLVREIYQRLLDDGGQVKALADEHGVSIGCVARIKSKKNWAETLKDLPDIELRHKSASLTDSQKEDCRALRKQGFSATKIAKALGVTLSQVEGVFRKRRIK